MNSKLKNSKTYLNLAKAYAGECQARTRYEFLKYASKEQGYCAIEKLIKVVITNEFNHARMLYTFIETADTATIDNIDICSGYPFKEKWDYIDNFRLAVEDETLEATRIYPEYQRVAEEEGFKDIAGLFKNLIQVENCHRMLFTEIYNQLKNKTIYTSPTAVKWKCGDCGYEHTQKDAWVECPLCQAKQGAVMLQLPV